MKPIFLLFALVSSAIAEKPNILLICVDDLRPELKSLGATHIQSPAMDSLVESGRAFTRHYVQAPTCGASRYAMLTGRYGFASKFRNNSALFDAAKDADKEPFSMPRHFREHGYKTVSVGKVSHHPGGLGGPKWDNADIPEMPGAWDISIMPTDPWKHPLGAMHGYADGIPRTKRKTPALEHKEGDDMRYTDGWITREALTRMSSLAEEEEPFLLAVGIMKPHLPFACPKSYRDLYDGVAIPPTPHPEKPSGLSTWHSSGEFLRQYAHDGRDPREDKTYAEELHRSYAACVSFADAQVAQLLAHLEETGLAENTIVILWGDHGYHLGEHAIWGKHALFEESLHAPLVIRDPRMEKAGTKTDAIVESIDIYPTLCELTGVATPDGLDGKSLVSLLRDPSEKGSPAISYFKENETVRTERYRLIRHKKKGKKAFELYDHENGDGETENIAAKNPALVKELDGLIDAAIR